MPFHSTALQLKLRQEGAAFKLCALSELHSAMGCFRSASSTVSQQILCRFWIPLICVAQVELGARNCLCLQLQGTGGALGAYATRLGEPLEGRACASMMHAPPMLQSIRTVLQICVQLASMACAVCFFDFCTLHSYVRLTAPYALRSGRMRWRPSRPAWPAARTCLGP